MKKILFILATVSIIFLSSCSNKLKENKVTDNSISFSEALSVEGTNNENSRHNGQKIRAIYITQYVDPLTDLTSDVYSTQVIGIYENEPPFIVATSHPLSYVANSFDY
ncbi:hypothetical protein [uncultured Vagococcus sp.]|uniref:hypothetical protein n=1 Tax=uncultured Vagococcus sp. TaxID=189676 RepID=UPI0028D7DC48|nr:hypothetical protein [uncultured Vagococcus sp.]